MSDTKSGRVGSGSGGWVVSQQGSVGRGSHAKTAQTGFGGDPTRARCTDASRAQKQDACCRGVLHGPPGLVTRLVLRTSQRGQAGGKVGVKWGGIATDPPQRIPSILYSYWYTSSTGPEPQSYSLAMSCSTSALSASTSCCSASTRSIALFDLLIALIAKMKPSIANGKRVIGLKVDGAAGAGGATGLGSGMTNGEMGRCGWLGFGRGWSTVKWSGVCLERSSEVCMTTTRRGRAG